MPKKISDSVTPALDPILPLPYGTQFPEVRQGDGKEIMANTSPMVVELPFRAFFMLWEMAERRASDYAKYVGGPLDPAAQTALEGIYACRNAFFMKTTMSDEPLAILSETQAQAVRAQEIKKVKDDAKRMAKVRAAKAARSTCPKCGPGTLIVKKKKLKDDSKLWLCGKCGHRWPRVAAQKPSEALQTDETVPSTRKSASGRTAGAKKPKKARQKAK